MRRLRLKGFGLLLLFVLVTLCSTFDVCDGRRGKHWNKRRFPYTSMAKKKGKGKAGVGSHHHSGSTRVKPSPSLTPTLAPPPAASKPVKGSPPSKPAAAVFDVVDYGAQGDGVTDDTKLEGTIIAPTNAKAWGSGLLQWLEFTKLRGITIQGSGIIEGRGSVWWTYYDYDYESDTFSDIDSDVDPALRFYGSYNVTVTGITIQNSPQCHLKFDNCEAVAVHYMNVSSPGNSLNTDGIHLQNSRDVNIHHTNLACGDDCISIQTGCTNVNIHNVNCGPGHGISIGGLGRDNTKACVSNITVRDINIHNTMTGVRIKTWQGGSGSVQSVRFSNIKVSEVQTPIIIDQFYCDRSSCKNQTSAVALAGIAYENIRGTFTVKPVHLACSDSSPCSDITLTQVELEPLKEQYHMYDPFCWQAYGELYTPTVPPIACLQNGKPASNRILSDHDTC